MERVPEHMRIKVLYEDEAVIVIDKPCNLRSVPGHANPPPPATNETSQHRLTAQESWMEAIHSFRNEEVRDAAGKWLRNLASSTTNLASVPRKWSPFRRYISRNQQRLKTDTTMNKSHDTQHKSKRRVDDTELDTIARKMHERIRQQQIPLMNLPEATYHEDSAFGQLISLRYANEETTTSEETSEDQKQLYVVHRLDCEVSKC